MKIDIVKINPEGDGVTALYINDALWTYGDYYHDKIDDWIQGFLEGLDYATAEYNLHKWEISGDSQIGIDIYEGGSAPPGLLEEYQGLLKPY